MIYLIVFKNNNGFILFYLLLLNCLHEGKGVSIISGFRCMKPQPGESIMYRLWYYVALTPFKIGVWCPKSTLVFVVCETYTNICDYIKFIYFYIIININVSQRVLCCISNILVPSYDTQVQNANHLFVDSIICQSLNLYSTVFNLFNFIIFTLVLAATKILPLFFNFTLVIKCFFLQHLSQMT